MKKILIIGSGSISKKHYSSIKNLRYETKVETISSRKFEKLNEIEFEKIKRLKPELIIICSPATSHLRNLKKIEKNFKNLKVLIEKPVFEKSYKIKEKLKNKYFVGYNLRFHPVIIFLKKFLRKKKIYSINIISHSYLPDWRKIDYRDSVSAKKKLGGGVLLELSHELDYVKWIFNKLKILFSYNNRISKLNIDTDDILSIVAKVGKNALLNLNINFFSKIPNRTIKIDGYKFSLNADLIKNKITIIKDKKINIKKFSNFNIKETYKLQCLEIFKNKYSNISTLNESLNLMKILDTIKKYK
jgi:predicted dehydrogenase